MTLQNDITEAVADFQQTRDIMRQIVHGDFTTVVTTENGLVKSLAKAIADLEAAYQAGDVLAQTQAYKADAYGWGNNPVDVQFIDSDGSSGFSAKHWATKSKASEEAVAEWMLAYGRNEVQVVSADFVADAAVQGFLLAVDATAGDVRIDLEAISVLGEPYSVRVVKTDDTANRVEVYPAVGDLINNQSDPIYITVNGAGYRFDTDADPDPDNWSAIAFGAASQMREAVYHFTATEGQTVFTGADDFGNVLAYEANHLEVMRGIAEIWSDHGDFTATDGVSVVLASGAIAGEQFAFRARSAFAVAGSYSTGETDALLARVPNVEIGAVMPFAMDTAPNGWLPCDGSAVSRAVYADLFAAVGETWGAGDGSTTFNLPDLREWFLRGASDTYPVGSEQLDQVGSHNHETDAANNVAFGAGSYTGPLQGFSGTFATRFAGGDETRPKNKAVLYCIKAFHPVRVLSPGPSGVNKTGDLMEGPFRLSGDAVLADEAVTKRQLDALRNFGYSETGAFDSTGNTISNDSSIPQIGEGKEFASVTFTPSRVGAVIEVSLIVHVGTAVGAWCAGAVFQNGAANAILTARQFQQTSGGMVSISGRTVVTAASTDEITFAARYGAHSGTSYLNGVSVVYDGGALKSSLMIREIA
ncbi:phage tail protein [Thalassospira xiamenensis]|uniref:phage tail protein n=1 Tax=Thalassospira xiamenensis TaxID=220697 RepID=UPI00215DBE7A|nr:phage tail protein [Thalassospira xiamenensis]